MCVGMCARPPRATLVSREAPRNNGRMRSQALTTVLACAFVAFGCSACSSAAPSAPTTAAASVSASPVALASRTNADPPSAPLGALAALQTRDRIVHHIFAQRGALQVTVHDDAGTLLA